jgi:small conductance mechanosensitive channel
MADALSESSEFEFRARQIDRETGKMNDITNTATEYADMIAVLLTTYGLSVLGGIVMLIVGWTIAGWARRAVDRGLGKIEKIDVTLRSFLASATRYLILVLTALAVLSKFGVQTASLITVFGAASLAIGLALQGTLSNLAAGVMLLFFRPFHVGDYVEAGGHAGTVKAIDLFMTEFATPDNVRILVPNGNIWGGAVVNYSHHPTRRVDFLIGIDYGDDIDKAFETIRGIIAAEGRIHADPEPMLAVGELADNSVNIVVRVWCDAGDYWAVKFDMTKAIKEAMDKAGISFPFPQRTVHVVGGGGLATGE